MRTVTDLKEIQDLAVEIFTSFKQCCEHYDLKYFLAYGTLIGAIRHHGFIPWDDDIDVWMPREDFDKLCQVFPEWEGGIRHYINCAVRTPGYDRIHAQICASRTSLNMYGRKPSYKEGYFIDVFPIDGLPSNKTARSLRLTHLQLLKNVGTMYSYDSNSKGFKNRLLFIGSLVFKGIDIQKVMLRYEKIARKTGVKSDGYVQIPYVNTGGRNMVLPAAFFSEGTTCEFENMECSIPKHFDEILHAIYGDYMTLPPAEKRVPHHHFDLLIEEEE
ncbi:MAG: LicD family protein [Clostridia bacterium]|nr:LicD family protein [Clostridia bacterium]